ncbi:Pregnancy-associated glycoprotein-like protein [Aphelenchoides fujianensis]|nr:Pregnancy-associated glycoprotein-like protein [Aphelenchoides fujianensis]
MRTTSLVVLLLFCVPLLSGVPLFPKGFSISGAIQKRNAAQLAEYRRQQRASPLYSKNFLLNYHIPDETLLATIYFMGNDPNHPTNYTVSLETATDWLYFFNTSTVNQTGLTPLNQTFTGKYENYDVNGYRYQAQVSYGSLNFPDPVTQTFAIVGPLLSVDNTSEVSFDGVLGLGWRSTKTVDCDTSNVIPPVLNIMSTSTEKQYYVIRLDPYNVTTNTQTYQIVFGESVHTCGDEYGFTDVVYAPAADNGFVNFIMDGLAYGETDIVSGGEQATVDAGIPVLMTTAPAFKRIYELSKWSYNFALAIYTVKCDDVPTMKDLVFQIGTQDYPVPASKYVADIGIGDGTCAVLIDKPDASFTYSPWILGQPFLSSHCVWFGVNDNTIGFALQSQA